MVRNAALGASISVLVLVMWTLSETTFLAPFRTILWYRHGTVVLIAIGVIWLNVFAGWLTLERWLLLRDTGRKLHHVDRQLGTDDTVLADLRRHMRR